MLEDALIEALVASAQQRQRGLGCELSRKRVVEHARARRERDHPPALAQLDGVDRIARAQSAFHDVYAQQHARPAPEGRVVHLPAAERRVIAEVHALEARPARQHVAHVALAGEPLKPLGKQREDVNLHGRAPRGLAPRRGTGARPRARPALAMAAARRGRRGRHRCDADALARDARRL